MPIKCIAFDADHTLYSINSVRAYNETFEFLSNRTGFESEKIRRTWLNVVDGIKDSKDPKKRSREYSTARALELLGIPKSKSGKRVKEALKVFWENVEVKANPLARETINELKKRKEVVVAVLSDEYREHLKKKLAKAGIPEFDLMICPEDTGEMKPSTRFYEMLMDITRINPNEILMIGDSWVRDLEPAQQLGLMTALYRKHEGTPEFFIDSLKEIVDIANGKIFVPEFFKSYDIRGKPPYLNPQVALLLGKVMGSLIPGRLTIVVGRDTKQTSGVLEKKLIEGMVKAGATVIQVGMGPTDFVSFATNHLKADFGVMVTSSHLPPEYNGFKFLYQEGNGFMNEDLAELKRKFMKNEYSRASGVVKKEDVLEQYLDMAEKNFKKTFSGIDSKVIVDTGLGASKYTAAPLLERLGADVITIERKRPYDCAEEKNISYLPKEMIKAKADIAVSFDLDADRIAVFDSMGEWVNGDELFCLADKAIVKSGDKVVASIDTSQMLEESTKGTIIHTRVGDPFVISEALKQGAILAGEPNGHYCFPRFTAYNSGTFFSAVFSAMAHDLHDMRASLPEVSIKRRKFEVENPKVVIVQLKREIRKNFKVISELDGVKFKAGNATALIRASGTSNTIRMIVEARTEAEAEEVLEILASRFFT
ncbi:MAG: HAD-IA family hydrolase [Candidatus Diapherotrites archaeon]|nr:HAD-IA family hydrolase [Candidatus Diapherotrites archaeon]